MRKKAFYLFNFLVFLLIFTTTCLADCKLIASWEPWDPFQYKTEKNELTGIDIDIIKAVIINSDCKISFRKMPWKRAIISIKSGEISLVMGASKTKEREKYAYFSHPYRKESFVLYIRKGESDKYKLKDLKDIIKNKMCLGTVRGYYYGEEFAELLKKNDFKSLIQEVHNDHMNYEKLLRRRIDGFLAEPLVATKELKKRGILDKFEIFPVKIYSTDIYAMFSKKSTSPEIVKIFNSNLEKIKSIGKYKKIIENYTK